METITSTIAVFSAAFLGIWVWKFLNWVWFNPRKVEKYLRQQGLSGNSYRLFFGDLKEGKIAFTWVGPRSAVFINDAEIVKEIFSKPYNFLKQENYHIVKLLIKGLAAANKDKWSRHRKIINPAFHLEKLKIQVPIFYSSCCDMVSKWEKIVLEKGSYELDLWPNLETLTSDALTRAAFGSNYEEGKKVFDLQNGTH
nr:cytochrome P450 CYP72A219-like [Nicotiana tomentosiformis]